MGPRTLRYEYASSGKPWRHRISGLEGSPALSMWYVRSTDLMYDSEIEGYFVRFSGGRGGDDGRVGVDIVLMLAKSSR